MLSVRGPFYLKINVKIPCIYDIRNADLTVKIRPAPFSKLNFEVDQAFILETPNCSCLDLWQPQINATQTQGTGSLDLSTLCNSLVIRLVDEIGHNLGMDGWAGWAEWVSSQE